MASAAPQIPAGGEAITVHGDGRLEVPDHPIIPVHRGRRHRPRHLARVACASSTRRSRRRTAARRRSPGPRSTPARRRKKLFDSWLPDETVDAFKKYLVGIKGPLTTPIGGGIRSLNVALRQMLDLYVCLRPVRYFKGVPSPGEAPGEGRHGDLPREHGGHLRRHRVGGRDAPRRRRSSPSSQNEMGVKKIRFPETTGIGIKPVSREGSERLVRAAIEYALQHKRKSVTLVHKGNIMKFTEGAFRDWGYALVKREFAGTRRRLGRLRRQAARGPGPRQGRHRRHHAAAGPHAPRRVRRHRDAEPERRLPVATRSRRRSAASASRRAATSTTSPATPSSRRRTAPRRSTPTSTR